MSLKNNFHPQTQILKTPAAPAGFAAQMPAVTHASTILFPNMATFAARHTGDGADYIYGTHGTPIIKQLEAMMAQNDGGLGATILPSGLAAVTVVTLSLVKAGEHVLIPDNVYGGNMEAFMSFFPRMGITHTVYDPMDLAALPALFQANTKLVWAETPGFVTFEVPDVAAIAAIAHKHHALLALDNTWSAGVNFKAFEHHVDVSAQAMTKYQCGHSDVLMGSVVWQDAALGKAILATQHALGICVSPDDAYLVIRGMQTMHLRLREQGKNSIELATWLGQQDAVQSASVLHPALPSCPGHATYLRDFKGAGCVFSFYLAEKYTIEDAYRFVDALQLFGIGASWAGTHSLALHMPVNARVNPQRLPKGQLIRLSIGLEHIEDLRADLAQAFAAMSAAIS